jgi:uncharacterized protein (TIGR03435 family)
VSYVWGRRFAILWLALTTSVFSAPAQSPVNTMTFDVASLRASGPGEVAEVASTRDGYRAINVPIMRLIVTAYVPSDKTATYFEYDRILGAPDWAKTEGYTLNAKIADADLAAWQNPDSQKAMLGSMMQSLLADRCKLTVHRETRELCMFALVTTKNGPRIKETPPADLAGLKLEHPGGITLPDGGILLNGGGKMAFFGVSMGTFSEMLSVPAGHPVQDKTGLPSRYDFTLQLLDAGASSGGGPPEDPLLSIFTAMQEQLGLRLQPEKSQAEVLVIDHIERPSKN